MQCVLHKFKPRHGAGSDGLVRIDDEGIGERCHGLKLLDHLFRTELDHLKLRVVRIAWEIVQLVTQHVGAARKLVLHQ